MADYISSHSGSQIDGAVDTVLNIQQTTGENTNYLMSQKAITDAITAAQPEIVQTTGTSETAVMSQKAVTDELNNKVDKVEGKGLSTNDFTTEDKERLNNTVLTSAVVQTTGTSETAIMSQKAVTNMYNGKINIDNTRSLVGEDIRNINGNAWVSGVGANIVISKDQGCSFGAFSECNARMGVSLGTNSVCDEEDTVSVGSDYTKRRIVNVADPINPQDVATKNYINNHILTNALNIYVNATSGADNNAGTEEAPYKTLTKAISVIPKLIQSSVTINVAAGEYEFPNIFGFSGSGSLTIVGAGDTTIYTNAINIGYNSLSYIYIANAQFKYTPQSSEPDKLYNNLSIIDLSGLKFTGTAETPLTSPLRISASNNVFVTNCTFDYFDTAISALNATRCLVTTLTCNNGTHAISVYNGAIVSLVNTISGATTNVTSDSTGGAIIYPNGTFTP